jgi:hypothetical protein
MRRRRRELERGVHDDTLHARLFTVACMYIFIVGYFAHRSPSRYTGLVAHKGRRTERQEARKGGQEHACVCVCVCVCVAHRVIIAQACVILYFIFYFTLIR